MIRFLSRSGLINVLLLTGTPVFTGAADALVLTDLLRQAQERNPDIQSSYRAWKMAEAQVGPAGAWPNPTFTYIAEKDPSGVEGVDPMNKQHYNVQQMVPFPGKLTLEAQLKHHDALLSGSRYQATRLEVLGEVRRRFYQLYLTDRSAELADQSVAIMKSVLRSAQSRLAAGQSSASDVFTAQRELRRMENMAFEQRQERQLIQAELNALLNRPVENVLGTAMPPALEAIPVTLEQAESLAARFSPTIQAGHQEVAHSQSMLTRGKLEFAPDFGFMYEKETMDAGPAGRQIGLSINFPLWFKKPWGEYRAAKEHVLEAENVRTGMQNMVRKMVFMRYVETQTHLTMVRNHTEGILPAAQSNLTIVRQQYTSGQGEMMRFLEAFRSWIESNLDYEKELYRYGDTWTDLERWMGVDLAQAQSLSEPTTPRETSHAH